MLFLEYKAKKVAYTDQGTGQCIVLLHGFTETQAIWKRFSRALSREFRVITIDLPGHGRTDSFGEVHAMEFMADLADHVLRKLGVKTCLMTGHSMGGFVTLAYAKKYPGKLKGICLFHSHPFEDTEEIRMNRTRTVQILKENHFTFLSQFIPSLFARGSEGRFLKEIAILEREADKLTAESLIASTEGMKLRPSSTEFLKTTHLPVLFIVGMKDTRAPLSRIGEMILLPKHSEALILKDIGHMGYIEAYGKTLETVWHFAKKVL
jgi:pimeloyl-ACP methyl ester carboxylesterase